MCELLTEEVADVIIGTARLDEYEGHAYSIGPMGVRVGFAFQQERSLNLVLALQTREMLNVTQSIAIVGGGLAGVMLKLALHGLGYAQAKLFETNKELMRMQRAAAHRPIHPCYNNWPMVDWFDPTTNFPFMNWSAGDADTVASHLASKWGEYQSVLVPCEMGVGVSSASLKSNGAGVPKTIELLDHNTESLGEFDLVLFATGFGLELDMGASGSDSYWEDDRVDSFRDRSSSGRGYVSGIGDGGLMDFARLCCSDRRSEAYLQIELISLLRHDKYSEVAPPTETAHFEQSWWETRIREIERSAAMMLPDSAAAVASRNNFGSDNENAIARYLANEYGKIVKQFPPEVRKLVDSALVNPERMFLIGRLETPFTCSTAPVNKLIVAYILSKSPSSYIRGELKIVDRSAKLVRFGNLSFDETFSEGDLLIIRHGANPPVYGFSGAFKDRNRILSRAAANLIKVDRGAASFCGHLSRVASDNPLLPSYIKHRKVDAIKFARTYFGMSPAIEFPGGSIGWLEINPDDPDFNTDEVKRRLGGIPRNLFGIPLYAVRPKKGGSATKRRQQ